MWHKGLSGLTPGKQNDIKHGVMPTVMAPDAQGV